MTDGLPEGDVTFLFSDVEASTRLLEADATAAGASLARHHDIFASAVTAHEGVIFETVGDAVYAAFGRPADAAACAVAVQRSLSAESWDSPERIRVRIAIHSGPVERRGDHYFGAPLFRCARLQAVGWGGQTLLSAAAVKLIAGQLPPGASLRDLAMHRLKDLRNPEQVYQLDHEELNATFPPLRSLDLHPTNLPAETSPFIGRDRELTEIDRQLDQHRLVTLTGPGGIGKTRLALQVARERRERHVDGVFLVDLSALRDPSVVPAAIARELGVPTSDAAAAEAVVEYGANRDLLIILDNLEQILGAGPDILSLLRRTGALRFLVTSRIPLRVRGERAVNIEPLSVPVGSRPATDAKASEAVQLFIEVAGEVRDDELHQVSDICRRLGGLPLAIELVATHAAVLGLKELVSRLDQGGTLSIRGPRGLPERQQTIAATIAWSEELLDRGHQRLFRWLSCFVAGFDLKAADAIGGEWLDRAAADGVVTLAEHGLVRQAAAGATGSMRWEWLEPIRTYAAERLEESGEGVAARDRHLAHFRERLREAYGGTTVVEDHEQVVATLARDDDNLARAVEWALERVPEESLAVALEIWPHWLFRGRYREARSLLERSLDAASPDETLRIRGLIALGSTQYYASEHSAAGASLRQAYEAASATSDSRLSAQAASGMAFVARETGDYDTAVARHNEALALYSAAGDDAGVGLQLLHIGDDLLFANRLEEAERQHREALAYHRERRSGGDLNALTSLALIAARLGDPVGAADYMEAADGMWSPGVIPEVDLYHHYRHALLALDEGNNLKAARDIGNALPLALEFGDRLVGLAAVDVVAVLAAHDGYARQAATTLSDSDGLRERLNLPRPPFDRAIVDSIRGGLSGLLAPSTATFAAAITGALDWLRRRYPDVDSV